MPEYESFDDFSQLVLAYFDDESTLQTAYDLMTEAAPRFPEQEALIYNWRFCAAAMMNKTDLALQLIQESLDAGFFWSTDYLTSDEDLKSLYNLPEFKRLTEVSEERYREVRKNSKPLSLSLPLPENTEPPLPLLLILHGNKSNAQYAAKSWKSAVREGWHTVLLQSSQIVSPFSFVWDDLELGAQDIEASYEQLLTPEAPETGPVVVGGFSKGGEMAIWLTLKEIIPLDGFIVVNPGGPYVQDVDRFRPLLEECRSLDRLRGWLVTGETDLNHKNVKALYEVLNSHGLNCQLITSPNVAHDYPEDFDQILARVLSTLC